MALRVLSVAYVHHTLPELGYIGYPPERDLLRQEVVLPQGPQQNPDAPLLADETLFPKCLQNWDFDHATLVRDRNRALQFFRWKYYMLKDVSKAKVAARAGDILLGMTNSPNLIHRRNLQPAYSFDASDLPLDTVKFLNKVQRKSPLHEAELGESLQNSKSFTVSIQDVVTEGSSRGFATVYKCTITSIDDAPVTSGPVLCLKLFDDRFQDIEFDEEEFSHMHLHKWFKLVSIADACAIDEVTVYEKLHSVQGTVIPWFYGVHEVTFLPSFFLCAIFLIIFSSPWRMGPFYMVFLWNILMVTPLTQSLSKNQARMSRSRWYALPFKYHRTHSINISL